MYLHTCLPSHASQETVWRLRVGLSHLHEHEFRHYFQDSRDSFCNCGQCIETTVPFFLHCSNYSNQRKTLFEQISDNKHSLLNQNDSVIAETLLLGSNDLNDKENAMIIESTINRTITSFEISNQLKLFSCLIVFWTFFFFLLYIIFVEKKSVCPSWVQCLILKLWNHLTHF